MTSESLSPHSRTPTYRHDHDHDHDDPEDSSASTPLRSASPLVIEEDEDLTSFFQQETHEGSAADPILQHDLADQETDPLRYGHNSHQRAKLTPFVALLTATACISGLLFGYDTGVVSSTLVSIGTDLDGAELSIFAQSLITSSTSLFALLASPPGGWLADAWGRRWVIVAADVLFVLGALIQAFSSSVWLMVLGRAVVGAGVGAASLITPLYISELAPPEFRGRLVVVNNAFITGGQMAAYVIGWWLAAGHDGWRWMVGLGAVPALVQLLLLTALPETPRWLIKAGRVEPARAILNRAYGRGAERAVDALVRAIEREVLQEEEARHLRAQQAHLMTAGARGAGKKHDEAITAWRPDGWAELLGVGGHRRALAIACMLQGLQQLCGFNVLMYFSATIFRRVGFESPILASLSVAVTNFAFTIVAMLLIDRIGRRRILLLTVPFMVLALLLTALAFRLMGGPSTSTLAGGSGVATMAAAGADPSKQKLWPSVILASIVTYVAFYAMGLGSVPWQQSELFPLAVRSLGCGIATATNWGTNFLVGLTFLPMMQLLTPTFTFALYAAVCALGWLIVRRIYPETRGLGLEEVGGLLKDGWGVKESLRRTKRP